VLESKAPDNPGPGNYKVEHDYPDYRGVYKNMGKLGKKKRRGSVEEDMEEVEEEVAAPVKEDSDGSEDENEAAKAVVEDTRTPEASQIVEMGPLRSKIPGVSIGAGKRTTTRDERFPAERVPGAGTYKNLPTSFPEHVVDKRKVKQQYE
jgi:hypothetical protein